MKVKELIEKLKKLDPDTRIMTRYGEGGFSDVCKLDVKEIRLNQNDESCPVYGPHVRVDSFDDTGEGEVVDAVIF